MFFTGDCPHKICFFFQCQITSDKSIQIYIKMREYTKIKYRLT